MTDRVLPAAPRSSESLVGRPSTEAEFWAGLLLDLDIHVQWLRQALDALPTEHASAEAIVRLRSYTRALEELRHALEPVQVRRSTRMFKPLFVLEGPLAAFLSRLYAWCEEIADDFERMAIALRNRRPTRMVFSHRAVNASYAEFTKLIAAVRTVSSGMPRDAGDAKEWRAFDEELEELVWATEWLHMTLARPPGD